MLEKRRIFIVEDNAQNRIVFRMALTRHGASVDFERWGRDAIHRLKEVAQIDLIILDLMLPLGVSGFDVFDQIRACDQFATVPIVAVSAMDPAIALPLVRSKGFSGFIAKPIDTSLFPQQIARILNGENIWHVGQRGIVSGKL
jgi:two-component system, cell cycle response regulator DivK